MPSNGHPSTTATGASSKEEQAMGSNSIGNSARNRRSMFSRSSVNPQVSRFQDHFTLQAPTSFVKFHDSKSAARVIFNGSSQVVIEENYDEEVKKRVVTIKQVPEEAGGLLKLLRLTYCLVGAFFTGFLFVFTMQTMYFVALDFSINIGLDDDVPHYGFAIGMLLSFPTLIHGFALVMMLSLVFLKDLWDGELLLAFACFFFMQFTSTSLYFQWQYLAISCCQDTPYSANSYSPV